MSSMVQLPLFKSALPIVSPADVDVHALSIPARAFTGDLFFAHRDGDRLWLVVADVAGKGLHASVVMAMLQEELERTVAACAASDDDPAVTVARLDAFVRPLLSRGRFVTLVIATLRDDGALSVVNAGHCPLLIARRNGSVVSVPSNGPVIGILPNARWTPAHLRVGRGESLLMYSDGVVEAPDRDGEEFGVERLSARFAAASGRSARSIAAAVLRDVRRHSEGKLEDDLTVLVARR